MTGVHAGRTLRALLESEFLLLPGAYSGISARLVAKNGFKGLYLSGAAIAAAQGLPDIGLVPVTDFARVIREMAAVTSLPILADADTGFGDPQMVARAVHEYNAAGAAGLHIEDQQLPKRCGHLSGKILVPVQEMVRKIKTAVEASRMASGGEFLICARTDAFAVEGFEKAVERARHYVEAGAEVIFPEGLASEKLFVDFASAMKCLSGPAPGSGPFLLANMTEFGVTPMLEDMYAELHTGGTLEGQIPRMYTRLELYETLRYDPSKEWTFPSTTTFSKQ